jgi:low affinity Fe/Cu permease
MPRVPEAATVPVPSGLALHRRSPVLRWLENLSHAVTQWTGSSLAFALAVLLILAWLASGPLFHYSDTWQLVINTGTTVITFLMVFLIQRTQNKDSQAIHLKLNEIVAAIEGASNRLVDVEDLSEEELAALHKYYATLAAMSKRDVKVTQSHSIEEAVSGHERKRGRVRKGRAH